MRFNFLQKCKDMLVSKKASLNIDAKIATIIGLVIIISITVAMAPTLFTGLNNMTGAPAYLGVVLPIIVGAGILMLIWRAVK